MIKKAPKVSIIIPIYNVENYLRECLDSVINQTLKDIEIICVNDGSTDNSLQILNEYTQKDNRIKIINKKNSGYGHSMNVGMQNATGEYIGIVEPDDYVKTNMFEKLYQKANELNLDFIKADFCIFTGKNNFTYQKLDKTGNFYNRLINIEIEKNYCKLLMNTWSGIYKRSFIEENKINHNETPGASFQDNGFWFKTLCYAKKTYFLNEAFYMNRRDNPNSSVKSKEKVMCIKEEYDYLQSFLDDNLELKNKFSDIYIYKKYQSYMFNFNRIDEKYKKEWAYIFADEMKKYIKNKEINFELFDDEQQKKINLLINNPEKFYKKYRTKIKFTEKIFSIKNSAYKEYKIITIFGFKIKFKRG